MTNLSQKIAKIQRKTAILLDKLLPVALIAIILNLSFPHISLAQSLQAESVYLQGGLPIQNGITEIIRPAIIAVDELGRPAKVVKMWVTAYNSEVAQTDNDPCTTASGLNLCQHNQEDIIATNYLGLPFGTKVRLPDIYPDKVFTVQDRMNARYYKHADIWMKDLARAKEFGRQYTTIEIYN